MIYDSSPNLFPTQVQAYFEALYKFAGEQVRRGQAGPGFHLASEMEIEVLRSVHELATLYMPADEERMQILKNLYQLSLDDGSAPAVFVKDRFAKDLSYFLHRNLLWDKNHASYGVFRSFQKTGAAFTILEQGGNSAGDCLVWHRHLEPDQLTLAEPAPAVVSNKDNPQVYYIPGIENYSNAAAWQGKPMPEHPGIMDEFDYVSHWLKKQGPLDLHYVQRHPHIFNHFDKSPEQLLFDSVEGFLDRFLLDDISHRDADGKRIRYTDVAQVKRNLSRHTFIGHCHGGKWMQALEAALLARLGDLGYGSDIRNILKSVGMVSFGYRLDPEFGPICIPMLSVCNMEDEQMKKYGPQGFSDASDVQSRSGVTHGWQGSNLHVESAHAPEERIFMVKGGTVRKPDPKLHDHRCYTQLDERMFRQGQIRDLVRVHPCALMIRDTVSKLVEASKEGIRDAETILKEQRAQHLHPDAIDASIAYVESRKKQCPITPRGRKL